MKGRDALSNREKSILYVLEQELRETKGKPYGRGSQSFGPLRQFMGDVFHCHYTKNNVAIWQIIETETKVQIIICKFEYIG